MRNHSTPKPLKTLQMTVCRQTTIGHYRWQPLNNTLQFIQLSVPLMHWPSATIAFAMAIWLTVIDHSLSSISLLSTWCWAKDRPIVSRDDVADRRLVVASTLSRFQLDDPSDWDSLDPLLNSNAEIIRGCWFGSIFSLEAIVWSLWICSR